MAHFLQTIHKELRHHLFDYLLLVTGGVLFLLFLRLFNGYRTYSFIIVSLFVGFYVFWGQYHHTRTHQVRLTHIVEYILIGFTVLFLMLLLIQP
jgi:hypothetical protein